MGHNKTSKSPNFLFPPRDRLRIENGCEFSLRWGSSQDVMRRRIVRRQSSDGDRQYRSSKEFTSLREVGDGKHHRHR